MILRPAHASLLFITQSDHAALAADLVVHFDGFSSQPRRDAILLSVREHDNGWRELDEAIVFDETSGRALDFIGVPEPVKQDVWPRGIDRLAAVSPYAAALVTEHALFVYDAHRDKPSWNAFFVKLERRRAALLTDAGASRADLAADYPFLALADLMSLSFCHGWPDVRERFGHRVHCDGESVIVSPPIVGAEPVPVRIQGRRVTDRHYASRDELRTALDAARVDEVAGEARGQDAAA